MRLPQTLADLHGLRAARWIRESTARQEDKYGPDSQREQQDRAVSAFGIVDAGIGWTVAHSGRTIAGMPETVRARPEGVEQTLTVPIMGRREWLRLVRSA